jgi:hypothetical protein
VASHFGETIKSFPLLGLGSWDNWVSTFLGMYLRDKAEADTWRSTVHKQLVDAMPQGLQWTVNYRKLWDCQSPAGFIVTCILHTSPSVSSGNIGLMSANP